MILNVNPEHVIELHEILCGLPFEDATMYDLEPPTERHPAVESMIRELEEHMKEGHTEEEIEGMFSKEK